MRTLLFFVTFCLLTQATFAGDTKHKPTGKNSPYIFLEDSKPFNSIEDVLKLPQFKDKVVYIDVWGYGCAVCMKEFNYLPALKKQFSDKQVAYLYIYNKIADTMSRSVLDNYWKKYSIEHHLAGTHLLAYIKPPQVIHNGHISTLRESPVMVIGKDILELPTYMIADKSGKIREFDAPRPDSGEKLVKEIRQYL